MRILRFLTAGESHGQALIGIVEGMPSGIPIEAPLIDHDLKRRQGGHGRGGRMKIESDAVEILSGVRHGKSTGAPVALIVRNRDWENWQAVMTVGPKVKKAARLKAVTRPRPGHADLAGAQKYDHHDVRDVLERSSARETAMRVAAGSVAKQLLAEFDIAVGSYVIGIGGTEIPREDDASEKTLLTSFVKSESSPVRCPDRKASQRMVKVIDHAVRDGDSLGGIFTVFAIGVPPGLGSHVQWDRKLDGRIAQAVMSIQAIKGVDVGLGFGMGSKRGSAVMDEIFPGSQGFTRRTNRAGGIEGGISNGMPVVIHAVMKPIPTLRRPLKSVDIRTGKAQEAAYERSDVCAVPAAAVVAEAMVALTIADAFLEKFGGDSRAEIRRNYLSYLSQVKKF